jgi:uncharacterized repeat protein (TIGR01451 family)
VIWFVGTLLLLLLALVLPSDLLTYAAYVLLGLLLSSRWLARSSLQHLTVQRRVTAREVEPGDTVAIRVTVHNSGWLPVLWVILEDLLPARALLENRARLHVKKKRIKIAFIRGGGRTTLDYEIEFRMRGYYQVGPLVLESGDLFGLHRRYRVAAAPHFILVYPKLIPLTGYHLASRRPVGEIRLTHRLFEDPTRIAGVRPYQAGDPLNRIHWRATARTGALHAKVYEPSSVAGATLVLDFHRAFYPEAREPYRSELAVTVAASLAHTLYLLNQQVGLVTNAQDAAERLRLKGWEGEYPQRAAALAAATLKEDSAPRQPLIVPTRRGAEQLQRILQTLARAELSTGLTFPQLLIEAASRLPRDATLVAILPQVTEETALALGHFQRRGYAVTAVLVRLEEAQEEDALRRLLAEGIDARCVHNEEDLAVLCQEQMIS